MRLASMPLAEAMPALVVCGEHDVVNGQTVVAFAADGRAQ